MSKDRDGSPGECFLGSWEFNGRIDGNGCPCCGAIGKGRHGGGCPHWKKQFSKDGKEL